MATISQPDSPRAIASRLNGAKSRGPKSEEGKARSSRNTLKHGLCSEKEVVAPGDAEGFAELQAALHARYRPRDAFEAVLVERIASCLWRLRRVVALEAQVLGQALPGAVDHDGHDIFGKRENRFMNLNRNETAVERSLHRTILALKEAKAEYDETNQSPSLIEAGPELRNEPNEPEFTPSTPSINDQAKERNEPKPARKSDAGDIETWTPGRRLNGPRRYPR